MESKMEKDPQSLVVQMKPEYASSEVYSTVGSEAPPAYVKRQANSVKIAKIIAATIILSSFILGGFMLASTYMQSRAMCDQMQTLENALDKEIMLEMLAQDIPKAAALQGRDISDNDIENDIEKPSRKDKDVKETSSSDSSYSDSDESQDMNRVQFKLPLDIDLNELASKFMQNQNQKTKMNCVVERRRAEELQDGAPAKMVQLPFGINLQTEQKPKRVVTGERIAIVCESNVEPEQEEEREEPEIHIRQFIVPFHQPQQMPIPYGRMPNPGMGPLTHMPMRVEPPREQQPHPMMAQMQSAGPQQLPPFLREIIASQLGQLQQQSARQELPIPPQIMQAPPVQQPQLRIFHAIRQEPEMPQNQQQQNQPEVRIQLHRIAIPGPIRIAEQSIDRDEQPEAQQQEPEQRQPEQGRMQLHPVPLNVALQRAGITPEDLMNIQKIAETNFRREMSRYIQDEIDEESDSSESSDEENRPQIIQIGGQAEEEKNTENTESNNEQKPDTVPAEAENAPQNPNILPMGRSGYARSLLQPVNIPVQMMPKGENVAAVAPEDSAKTSEN
ncbi:uncharacterized protein LOC134832842 [Culicoides brevitarsis]|uniref:uncharacterized protein LOC134832842 n=1 Tax=Culicoides brevitarsis TaxID=469753 RepID=UPI00307B42DA